MRVQICKYEYINHMYIPVRTCTFENIYVACTYVYIWVRLVGSFKLQVSFAEYRLFYRALLQKRPIILRSLLIIATPYMSRVHTSKYVRTYA